MIEVVVAMIGAVAVVAAATMPVVISLRKARDENREQHADNKQQFQTEIGELKGMVGVMHSDVRDIRSDLTNHLIDHPKDLI